MRRALFAVVALGGCYNPSIQAGTRCDDVCPGGLACIEHVCIPPGTLPPEPDASTTDAAVDGRAIDGPPGDVDADTITDDQDNCPSLANLDQHDEDGDDIGDVCDPCPHLTGTAADQDGDGVGDACDPQPTIAKQKIKFFDPFTTTKSQWANDPGAAVMTGALEMAASDGDAFTRLSVPTGELRIVTAGTIVSTNVTPHQLSIAYGFSSGAYYYSEFYDPGNTIAIAKFDGTNYVALDETPYTGSMPTGAFGFRIDESVAAQSIQLQTTLGGVVKPLLTATASSPALAPSATMTIYIQNIDVRFDYWLVIETTP